MDTTDADILAERTDDLVELNHTPNVEVDVDYNLDSTANAYSLAETIDDFHIPNLEGDGSMYYETFTPGKYPMIYISNSHDNEKTFCLHCSRADRIVKWYSNTNYNKLGIQYISTSELLNFKTPFIVNRYERQTIYRQHRTT